MKYLIILLIFLSLSAYGQNDGPVILQGPYENMDSLLAQFRGKVVYIDFWASWCKPCMAMMPHSRELQRKLKDEDIVFLYLAIRDKEPNWKQKRDALGLQGYHYLLQGELAAEAKRKFNVYALPHYSMVGKNGEVAYVQALSPDYKETEKDLRKLLEE